MKGLKRKIAGLCGGALLALCFCLPVQAGTITFDEYPAGTSSDLWNYPGVTFSPGSPSDPAGTIMPPTTWGLDATNGTQFAAFSVVGENSGFQVTFDDPLSDFSIDFARGEGSDVTDSLHVKLFGTDPTYEVIQFDWDLDPIGEWGTMDLDSIIADIPVPVMAISIQYATAGSPNMGFDNMSFNVPIPASFLLLGSGLIPLVVRRKRK